ncbi:uncharacterized protein LOC108672787 [Hyalella azteca]|uniref:Uncharacterized protein LOC108672787 n=1 Tax=Hyalella azteca TaxID=294128 RepID=A0A8B7NQP6_HYAAZ|nr:uncharacterized protein LOC108672787 [Hyalella azteca]
MFRQEMAPKFVKVDFRNQIGAKFETSVKESIDDCDEGLRLMNEAQKVADALQVRKAHLLKQRHHIRELSRVVEESHDSASLQENHWHLCKIISRADEEYKNLEKKIEAMCFDMTKLETKLKKTYKALQEATTAILPEELLRNGESWTIHGEYEVRKALATLNTSDHKPSGPVVVISTGDKPIQSLSELLLRLGKGGHQVKIKLLDSFWAKETPLADCAKLEHFIKEGYGVSVLSFMGHMRESTLQNLGAKRLRKIGLRLETASDVNLFNDSPAIDCYRHICISKRVSANDFLTKIKRGKLLCIHVVALEDKDLSWFTKVLEKLIPDKSDTEIYLPACGLTDSGVMKLLQDVKALGGIKRLWFEKDIFPPSEKVLLESAAKLTRINLEWDFTHI